MTNLYSTVPALDLPTLDSAIRSHLQAYARRVGGRAERYAMNSTEPSSCTAIVVIDPDQDLFSGCSEAIHGYRLFAAGYDAALSLAVVTSRTLLSPNGPAVAAVLRETREQLEATVAADRAKWGLSA